MDLKQLKEEATEMLQSNILSYWMNKMQDKEHGGFYGQRTGEECLVPQADKGAILNARILWTFSSAYRMLGKEEYLQAATSAKDYIITHFYDKEFGGVYWSVNHKGEPVDTKKQIYALGFTIYGLSEYNRATGDAEALEYAIRLYHSIEEHSFDKESNGYLEALTRDWQQIEDMRLSEKDANEKKTMNTHLHILEPYTNLYRVWKDEGLRMQLANLIRVFLDNILDERTHHLNLFFDENWNSKYKIVSYGHDIEASWLLHEAALVLGDKAILERVEKVIPQIVEASEEGLQPDGSLIYELNEATGHKDFERHWWVQSEAVIGYLNIHQYYGSDEALNKAMKCWEYIKQNLVDEENGEWYWSIKADGAVNVADDKAGFWKCPYHNGRMCMEIIDRFR